MNSGTVGNGLVRVDTLAGFLAKVFLEHLLDLGDTSGTTDKNNVVNVSLLSLGILENLLNRLESLLEKVVVEFLKLGTGQSLGEILALVERLDFDASGGGGRESTLGLFGLTLELTHGLEVLADVAVGVLGVPELDEVVHDTVVEILTTKMGVTSSSANFEDTVLDGEKRHIESTTTKIVNDDVPLLVTLVQTVSESSRSGLVDHTKNIKTSDGTGVLCSGTLGIVEVGGYSNNGVVDLFSKISFSDFLHLAQNHGRDLFRSESLFRSRNLNGDTRLTALVDDLEWEVLDIILNVLVAELAANHALNVKYCPVVGISMRSEVQI